MSDAGKMTGEEINTLLSEAPVGHLGLAYENQPYIVPLNYLYSDGALYFHCALNGRKIDYIKANSKACFQVGRYEGLITSDSACSHNYQFSSVILEGTIEEVTDVEAKETALRGIVAKYGDPALAEKPIPTKKIEGVSVYRIVVETISGKTDS
jgi:uncharacterized protein